MSAHSESAVMHARPILQIVFALEARPRPIRNFIMTVSIPRKTLGSFEVELYESVIVNLSAFSPRASFFFIQHVNGNVFGYQAFDPIQVFFPDVEPLVRQSGNQIDVDV